MARSEVKNPTASSKAVRGIGGHVVLKGGVTKTVNQNWTEEECAKYKRAGLTWKDVEDKAKPVEPVDTAKPEQTAVTTEPVKPAEPPEPVEPTEPVEPSTPQSRDDIIKAAIASLPEGEASFTQTGKPRLTALNAAMPEGSEPVTEAERNALWEAIAKA